MAAEKGRRIEVESAAKVRALTTNLEEAMSGDGMGVETQSTVLEKLVSGKRWTSLWTDRWQRDGAKGWG